MIVALAWVFILLVPVNWWAFGVLLQALLRHRDVHALRLQLVFFGVLSVASSACAVLGGSYLLRLAGLPQLPPGVVFGLLVLVMVAVSVPGAIFLVDHYRRR